MAYDNYYEKKKKFHKIKKIKNCSSKLNTPNLAKYTHIKIITHQKLQPEIPLPERNVISLFFLKKCNV